MRFYEGTYYYFPHYRTVHVSWNAVSKSLNGTTTHCQVFPLAQWGVLGRTLIQIWVYYSMTALLYQIVSRQTLHSSLQKRHFTSKKIIFSVFNHSSYLLCIIHAYILHPMVISRIRIYCKALHKFWRSERKSFRC